LIAQVTEMAHAPLPVFEAGIPMRDGIELAADVYLPREEQRPAPAIVQITPYDKSGIFTAPEGRFYQEHGYVAVNVDCRGRGKSEGEWRAVVNDPQDGHDVVEWVAAQPWCNGKVGMTGISYMGWTQWAAASERPPHLTCLISTSAAGRWQQEIPYTSGCLQLYFAWWVFIVRRRLTELAHVDAVDWDEVLRRLPLEAIREFINPSGQTWDDLVGNDKLDTFWEPLRFDNRYHQIDVPCLHVTGWFDLEDLTGAFHHYEHMLESSPAHEQQFLIVGPWSHINSRFPHHSYAGDFLSADAAVEMDDVHLRWFDYWLKGEQNGALDEPRVQLYETGSNVWRTPDRWPVSRAEESLYLHFDGRDGSLMAQPPREDEPRQTYRYDPLDPAPTQMNVKTYPFEEVPRDQTAVEARPDVITYTSAPLTDELVISGWPHLEFFAASDGDDTDWHVKLTDVHPDGRSMKVCQGCLRASHRDSLAEPTPLTPGQVQRFDVELWPAHHAFLPGHRVRVSITSSDFPWFARNLNHFGPPRFQADPRVATNSIAHTPTHASRLRLPLSRGQLPG
jgi:putative CocE/NonD family hydrolase